MNLIHLATTAFFALLGSALVASPLDEPRVNRIVNEVSFVAPHGKPRRAAGQETLRGDGHLQVGPRSRAELIFPDRTLVRLGSETVLGFRRGTRDLALERGTLLLAVPGFRGGARIQTSGLTAVCGASTILVEHLPSQSLKIVVLEGDVRVATGGFFGDSVVIPPGKMLITALDVKLIPDPVDVDLSTLMKTSALLHDTPLASLPRIERELARQAAAFKVKRLIPTNLAIIGSGTNVVIPAQPAPEPSNGPTGGESSGRADGRIVTEIPKSAEIAAQGSAEVPTDSVIHPSNP